MCPATRTGTFNGIRHTDTPTGLCEGQNIIPPGLPVEIGGEKPACLVGEHGIDADDVPSLKMIQDHVGGYGQKRLIGAHPTSYPGLLAYPADPFVGTSGRVSLLAALLVLPQHGIHIVPTSEEAEKKRYFLCRCEALRRSDANLV
jgi:hypothetical protein